MWYTLISYAEGTERPVGIYATRQTEGGHQLELGDLLQLTEAEDWLFEVPHDFVWLTGLVHYCSFMLVIIMHVNVDLNSDGS